MPTRWHLYAMHTVAAGEAQLEQLVHMWNIFLGLHCVRDHPLRSTGRLRSVQLARELLHCLPVQHAVCWSHLCLPDQDGHLGSSERAHPCLWSVYFHFEFVKPMKVLCIHISVGLCWAEICWTWIAVSYVFLPLAPFPSGLVSLPQIERIQFFQESVKGQEESQVPLGTLRHTAPDPSQHTHTL